MDQKLVQTSLGSVVAPSKPWYESWTIWLNILGIVALILQSLLSDQLIPYKYQAVVLGLLNIYQRVKSFRALTL